MQQWGYKSSMYCPESKFWILSKKAVEDNFDAVEKVNSISRKPYFILKQGFVDYWKGF